MILHSQLSTYPLRNSGFTLLEMILVLFLIGLMASATLLLTENVEDQAKYDETKRRMVIIRTAIIGDATRKVNGGTEISGFAADMGRLPACLRELLEQSNCQDASGALPAWSYNSITDIYTGWRGPYIQATPERTGNLRFRDGYGNSGATTAIDSQNSGWVWRLYDSSNSETTTTDNAVSIRIQSSGATIESADDYPSGAINSVPNLIDNNDFQVTLQNWDNLQLIFQNLNTSEINIGQDSLRLKLSYPENGEVNVWPSSSATRDTTNYLSATFPNQDIRIPGINGISVSSGNITIPTGSTLSGTQLSITTSGELDFSSAGGGNDVKVNAGIELLVPSGTTLSGTTLLIASTGVITFPSNASVLNIGLQNPQSLRPPIGTYSLIIVCEHMTNSTTRFDGDCSRYGTNGSPIAYTPLTPAQLFQVPARSNAPVSPSPFVWAIQ